MARRSTSQPESRIDIIKSLTDSLSGVSPAVRKSNSIDANSVQTTDSQQSLFYRYGQEIPQQSSTLLLPSSIPLLGRPKLSSAASVNSEVTDFNRTDYSNFDNSTRFNMSTDSMNDDAHLTFLMNQERNRAAKSQKVVSGSQFRLLTRESTRCDHCELWERTCKKLKENIRSLKLQLMRQEEKYKELKMTKSVDLPSQTLNKTINETDTSFGIPLHTKSEENSDLQQRLADYEEEMVKLRKVIGFERSANDALRKNLEELRESSHREMEKANEEIDRLHAENSQLKFAKKDADATIEELNSTLRLYKIQLEKAEKKINELTLRLSAGNQNNVDIDSLKEIQRLKEELDTANINVKDLTTMSAQSAIRISHLSDNLDSANNQIAALIEEVKTLKNDLKDSQNEVQSVAFNLESAKSRAIVLEDTLKNTVAEKEKLSRDHASTLEDLHKHQKKINSLEDEIKQLNRKLSDMMHRLTIDSENTKRALEKAITASIKLCVVAPTVNVHVPDAKQKFKSGLNSKALQSFLQEEVLEKYRFLYKQRTDSSAPDGSNMEVWLQKMLTQMQGSIEHHVNAAMDGSSL